MAAPVLSPFEAQFAAEDWLRDKINSVYAKRIFNVDDIQQAIKVWYLLDALLTQDITFQQKMQITEYFVAVTRVYE